jgi:hypothetical protein
MSHDINRDAEGLQKRLDRIEGLLERVLSQQKQDAKWRSTFKSQMNALMRAQFLGSALTGTEALQARRFRVRSQNEEDGIVLALLQAAGAPTRKFVEIGCGGNGGNSGLLAYEFGWEGLLLDASGAAIRAAREVFAGKPRVRIERATVTPENINDLLTKYGFAGEVDFLSIDVDSIDYWLLDALTVTTPRVLAMEYNSLFGPSRSVTVPNAERPQGAKGYHGASLAALEKVARRKGYRLVLVEDAGINAFFVREGLAPAIPTVAAADAWRPKSSRFDVSGETPSAERDIYKMIDEKGLTLVDV